MLGTRMKVDGVTPERRCAEVAEILARAIVRLRIRAALPSPENPLDSAPNCLEVSRETRLSVHPG
jgi:hypothetical protein